MQDLLEQHHAVRLEVASVAQGAAQQFVGRARLEAVELSEVHAVPFARDVVPVAPLGAVERELHALAHRVVH